MLCSTQVEDYVLLGIMMMLTSNCVYTQRLACVEDAPQIAPLWQAFAQQRAIADPSMQLKPGFDFEQYIAYRHWFS